MFQKLDNLSIIQNLTPLISKDYSFVNNPGVIVNDEVLNSLKLVTSRVYIIRFSDEGGSYSTLLFPWIESQWRASCVIGTDVNGSVGFSLIENGYTFVGKNARVHNISIYEIKL